MGTTGSPAAVSRDGAPGSKAKGGAARGRLVVNADDWGRDRENTDRILDCITQKTVSSVSAMVLLKGSERGADLALQNDIDAGLHLNLTTAFPATSRYPHLVQHFERVAGFLRRHRLAPLFFHPGLTNSFEYLVRAQTEEFERIYGRAPDRIDGHHHMHLCANILWGGLLPRGIATRRHFAFQPGEKSLANRLYRNGMNRFLARRYVLADQLFPLAPVEEGNRLASIIGLARTQHVELETHPVQPEEHRFLCRGPMAFLAGDIAIAPRFRPRP